jgi:hypothetical protein
MESILDIPDIDVPPSPPLASTSLPLKRPHSSPERDALLPIKRKTVEVDSPTLSMGSNRPLSKRAATDPQDTRRKIPIAAVRTAPPRTYGEWSCPICTLINNPLSLQCNACGSSKLVDPALGWTCLGCGEPGNQVEWWTCKECGRMKSEAAGG